MNNQNKSITLLFNPFFYIAGVQALGLGLAAMFLAGLVGSWGHAHFDGVLEMHVGAPVPLWFFLAEGVIDWLCLSVVLLVCGKIISQSAFRAVDLLGTQALARWPTLFMALLTLPPAFQRFNRELLAQLQQGKLQFNLPGLSVFVCILIAMIPLMCWVVALMYRSFSVSCNVKGGKAIGTFIAGLLIAEVLSKFCIVLAVQHVPLQAAIPAKPAPIAPAAAATSQTGDDLTGAGEHFVDLLVKGDFAEAIGRFDATMKSALPEPKLREVWQSLQSQAGPFKQRLQTRVDKQAGYDIVFVTCQFAQAKLDAKVVFDDNQQITGLFFAPTAQGPINGSQTR